MSKRKDPLLKTFGWRVRQLRDAKRWTQEVLAERADLDAIARNDNILISGSTQYRQDDALEWPRGILTAGRPDCAH